MEPCVLPDHARAPAANRASASQRAGRSNRWIWLAARRRSRARSLASSTDRLLRLISARRAATMAAVSSWGDAYRENAFSERTTGWGEPVDEDAGGALARSDRDMAASYREEGVPRSRLRSLLARPEACHEKS